MKRALKIVAVLVALLLAFVVWGFYVDGTSPSGQYALDLIELRRLGDSIEGEKPTAVHTERIAEMTFPQISTESGGSWSKGLLAIASYQLIFPSRTALVDLAFDEATGKKSFVSMFDTGAYGRLIRAMDAADFFVMTHEHNDHFGGFITNPRAEALAPKMKVTAEQLADPTKSFPLTLAESIKSKLTPLVYSQGMAVAPGVVLWKAAGHSPGSQMVYVHLENGEEFLFLGDVAWMRKNIDDLRGRPRVVSSLMLKEDRGAVAAQLAAVKSLNQAYPELHVVPGHDPAVMEALIASHALTAGFVVP